MGIKGRQYRNQTQLHEWLTERTLHFLHSMCTARGLIWRQEHTIHNGMRPDAIGFCSLQSRFEKQFAGRSRDCFNWKETDDFMFVFETKISYSDFKNSFNGSGEWKEKPYANFHFLVVPKDFSSTFDLSAMPEYWGILEPNPEALKIIRYPQYFKIERDFFLEAAYTILFKWGRTFNHLSHQMEQEAMNDIK